MLARNLFQPRLMVDDYFGHYVQLSAEIDAEHQFEIEIFVWVVRRPASREIDDVIIAIIRH